jgi:hypothetical protein
MQALTAQKPTISDALKNLLSLKLAARLTSDIPADPLVLQQAARCLLRAINAEHEARWPGVHGGKAVKACGRPLLTADFWAAARGRAEATRPDAVSTEALAELLDDFERSFKDGVVEPSDVELGKLTWAEDYSAAVRENGVARRLAADATEADMARDASDGQAEAQLSSLVRSGLAGSE